MFFFQVTVCCFTKYWIK